MREPYGHTIFCDDIRLEVGNKYSYMGCYTGEMVFTVMPGPPPALPKFCAAVQIIAPRELEFERCRVMLIEETADGAPPHKLGELEIGRLEVAQIQPPPDVLLMGANFLIGPLPLRDGSFIRARGYLDETEVKAGSLRVRLQPMAPSS